MGIPTWFSSSWTQLVFMSMVLFSASGMWNALNSMGVGGGADPAPGNVFNAVFTFMFMMMSFFGSVVVNTIGAKWSLVIGAFFYPYAAIVLNQDITTNLGAVAAVAIVFGSGAGIMYVAQGKLMMSYPPDESQSGKYIATFWAIFNSGTVIGVALQFGLNFSNDGAGDDAQPNLISQAGYWTFFGLMFMGSIYALFILPIHRVTHKGVPIGRVEEPDEVHGCALVTREFKAVFTTFKFSSMLLMTPLFFCSNFFYAYHFSIPAQVMNGRTAALANITYWSGQIVGVWVLQQFLDRRSISLNKRMYVSFFAIYAYIIFAWSLGGVSQYHYPITHDKLHLDFGNQPSNLPSPNLAMISYAFYGVCDAFIQLWSYWMMRNITDDPATLARFAGFYKFWQNTGNLISWIITLPGIAVVPAVAFWINVALLSVCSVPAYMAIHRVASGRAQKQAELEMQKVEQ